MRGWYSGLPLHRKLVLMALAVTTVALTLAVTGLIVADAWRHRATATEDTRLLAAVIAENTAAAVLFYDVDDARQTLATVAVRESVRRACLYLPSGELFASFARDPDRDCAPAPPRESTWMTIAGSAPIVRNGETIGVVTVERELTELWTSVTVGCAAGVLMLLLAGLVALPIADRLNRRISEPIVQLAAAARATSGDAPRWTAPPIMTELAEISELVRAFSDMLARVGEANDALRRKETERAELLEREREASRLKDEFLAAVSHELRTPLSTIANWAQVLGVRATDPELTARGIASIARSAEAQARVIEDLVDVSRIVAGKLTLRDEVVDLREAVDRAIENTRPAAAAKRIEMVFERPGHACLVRGDRDRLQQVFSNLAGNAVKFTPAGGTVRLALTEAGGGYEVDVTDSGIGIDAEFLPHVFDRFRQADGSLTRHHGGLGLGLAIVREITVLHGGTVSAHSDGRDRGASFRVRLPAWRESLPDGPVVSSDPGPGTARALAGVRVLAVDDNPDALEVLRQVLHAAGADVVTAESGLAALASSSVVRPDVLLCDLSMPGMDGHEVLRRVRQQHAGGVPAIALSAHATAEHRRRSREAGFEHHVAKPYRIETLLELIALTHDGGAAASDEVHRDTPPPGAGRGHARG